MVRWKWNTFNLNNKRDKLSLSYPLFLCTYRSEYNLASNIVKYLEFNELELSPLSKSDSLALIEHYTSKLSLDKQTITDLFQKSKGNLRYYLLFKCDINEN